jgi:hypothetical protein
MKTAFANEEIPYFSWDRALTAGQIKEMLRMQTGRSWSQLAAWIMREAAFADVWQFVTPQEVWQRFGEVEPFLGRRREFWRYILKAWHELGKV